MADLRVFRIHFDDWSVSYGNRWTVVNTVNAGSFNYSVGKKPKRKVVKIMATNYRATAGWIDVTREFEFLKGAEFLQVLYCKECGKERGWFPAYNASHGSCDLCGNFCWCSYASAEYLPPAVREEAEGKGVSGEFKRKAGEFMNKNEELLRRLADG